jgi:hypothetical protein
MSLFIWTFHDDRDVDDDDEGTRLRVTLTFSDFGDSSEVLGGVANTSGIDATMFDLPPLQSDPLIISFSTILEVDSFSDNLP